MVKDLIFLDTNVAIGVANGKVPVDDWNTVKRYIGRNFNYRISPLTLVELLIGVRQGGAEYFDNNRQSIKVLASLGGEPRFLPFPGSFAGGIISGTRVAKPNFEPKDLTKWLTVMLRAGDKAQLLSGVEMPGKVRTLNGMDLDIVEADLQSGKNHHIDRLQRVRTGMRPIPTRTEWGYVLRDIVPLNDADALRVTDAFDAAYELDNKLFELARNNLYDFNEHDSDFLDMQQLLYLCHPAVHMVTMERKLPDRIKGSSQRARVLRFGEILANAKVACNK